MMGDKSMGAAEAATLVEAGYASHFLTTASWARRIDFLTMDDQHRANEHCRSPCSRPHDDADSPRVALDGRPDPDHSGPGARGEPH